MNLKPAIHFIVYILLLSLPIIAKSSAPLVVDSSAGHSNIADSLEIILRNGKTRRIDYIENVEILNMLGRLYTDRDIVKAKTILHQSLKLADSINYKWGQVQAYKYLGLLNENLGYIAISASYFQKAIQILKNDSSDQFRAERYFIESYPAGRIILGPLTTKFTIPRDSSILYLEKCLALKMKLNDNLGIADAYDRLAFEFWDKGYNEKNKDYFSKAMKCWLKEREYYQRINFEDGVAFANGKIGVGYQYMGDSISALKFYKIAFRMSNLLGNKVYMSRNLVNIASMNLAQGKRDSAKYFYRLAIKIASDIQYIIVAFRCYAEIAKVYEEEGNYKLASECYQNLYASRDLHFSQSHLLTVIEMQSQYENQARLAQIKQLQLENELRANGLQKKNLIIIFSISTVVIVLAGGYVLLRKREQFLRRIKEAEIGQKLAEQKDRIGRDLHDSLGGQLSSISLGANRLTHDNNDNTIQIIQELADNALGELRNSLWVMDKEWISISELEQRINSLLWQYRKIEIPMDFEVRVDETLASLLLPSAKAGHLFRIIQEAVHNSIKHSKASNSKVFFEKIQDGIQVIISDDGVGFNKSILGLGEHYGIRNMQHRADQMNAKLLMETSPESGVKIFVAVPLSSAF